MGVLSEIASHCSHGCMAETSMGSRPPVEARLPSSLLVFSRAPSPVRKRKRGTQSISQEGDSKRVQLALICGLILEGAGTKIGDRKNKNDQNLARFDRSQIESLCICNFTEDT